MSTPRKTTKRARRSPQELLDAVQERLDATPERLARARAARADADPRRRPDPPPARSVRHHARQPAARAARSEAQRHPLAGRRIAAPDPSAGEARSVARGRPRPAGSTGFGPRPGLPQSEPALHARDKLRDAEERVGPHAWPIVTRIVIEGAGVRDCRGFVPELATPWRVDAVVSDRLRVALDMLGGLMGVTARRDKRRD